MTRKLEIVLFLITVCAFGCAPVLPSKPGEKMVAKTDGATLVFVPAG